VTSVIVDSVLLHPKKEEEKSIRLRYMETPEPDLIQATACKQPSLRKKYVVSLLSSYICPPNKACSTFAGQCHIILIESMTLLGFEQGRDKI
jgi:hypothetical protein